MANGADLDSQLTRFLPSGFLRRIPTAHVYERTGVLKLDQINPRSVLLLSLTSHHFMLPTLMFAARQPRNFSREFDPPGSPLFCPPASFGPCILVPLPTCLLPFVSWVQPPVSSLQPPESNRYTLQTGFPVTPTKQTTVILSSRYKKPPPGGVPSWLPSRPTLDPSNQYTPRIESALTHSKQTTVVLSNRYKKPPPGRVLLCKHFALYRPALSGGFTGFGGASRAGLMAISIAVFFGKTTSCPRAMKCV
jgi:hypothetical protein